MTVITAGKGKRVGFGLTSERGNDGRRGQRLRYQISTNLTLNTFKDGSNTSTPPMVLPQTCY